MSHEIYKAFDGKVFNDYTEYSDYENAAVLAPYKGKICFLNSNMEEMPLLLNSYENGEIEYLCIIDDATAQSAAACLKNICDWFNFPTKAGFYQSHHTDEEWFNIDDICGSLEREIQELQNKRKSAFKILGR